MSKLLENARVRFSIEIGFALLLLIWVVFLAFRPIDPVPKFVLSGVSFPVYYPVQNGLPSGFSLDTGSFRLPQPDILIFSVNYGHGQSIVFSEEAEPSGSVIHHFTSDYLPLHSSLQTKLGNATVGAYNNSGLKSVISLPINHGPWVIASAPSTINQANFDKVIESLAKS